MTREEIVQEATKHTILKNYNFLNSEGKFTNLGEGGSGYVLLAKQKIDDDTDLKRAIKFFIFKEDLWDKLGIISNENFKIEIANLCNLSHQNIIKVIDGNVIDVNLNGNTYSVPYIITEYINGWDAETIFKKKEAKNVFSNEDNIFEFFIEIVSGIEYLHKNEFYHCDIAPKNIFIKKNTDNNYFAIVGDLGAAKSFYKIPKTSLKEKVYVIGTRKYMPSNVTEYKDQKIPRAEFKKLQPQWDIFGTIHSFLDIITKIKEMDPEAYKKMWNLTVLFDKLQLLLKKLPQDITEIKESIKKLQPNKLFGVAEISESDSGMNQKLLPIGSAFLTKRIIKIINHPTMLRLIDVPQLFSGSNVFPGANHTRYEHSLGTYELTRKSFISLMRNAEFKKFFSSKDIIVGLLSALLSSVSCFPYSHAFSELSKQGFCPNKKLSEIQIFEYFMQHKVDGEKSIMDIIDKEFIDYKIQLEEIEYIIFGKQANTKVNDAFEVLHKILNSSIGIRVIDYLMRDAHHIGMEYKINLEDLVKNMRIYNNNFYLNQHGLVYAEQIILNRYWMYKRIYWNEPNRANMCLMKNIVYYAVAQGKNSANKILDAILSCTYKDFLTMLHEIRIKDKSLSDIYGHNIDFIKNKGNKRYKNILFFGKSSSMYPECNETYDKFNQKNYAQQEQIRLKIEKKITEKYKVCVP